MVIMQLKLRWESWRQREKEGNTSFFDHVDCQ